MRRDRNRFGLFKKAKHQPSCNTLIGFELTFFRSSFATLNLKDGALHPDQITSFIRCRFMETILLALHPSKRRIE